MRSISNYKKVTNVTLLTSKKTLKYHLIKELKKEINDIKVYTDFNLNYPKNNKNGPTINQWSKSLLNSIYNILDLKNIMK